MENQYQAFSETDYEMLFTGATPAAQIRSGTLSKLNMATTYNRGTVLAMRKDGKLYILGDKPGGEITEDFDGDSSATTFTLTATVKPLIVKSAKVGTVNATISEYNAQTGVVTLSSAPASGTKNVHVTYDRPDADVPDCILCNDTVIDTTDDVKTAVYTAGCFDPDKVAVKSGYTITESDKDKLRERGIVFKAASAAN